jgi:hypothetical protein
MRNEKTFLRFSEAVKCSLLLLSLLSSSSLLLLLLCSISTKSVKGSEFVVVVVVVACSVEDEICFVVSLDVTRLTVN